MMDLVHVSHVLRLFGSKRFIELKLIVSRTNNGTAMSNLASNICILDEHVFSLSIYENLLI